MRKYFSYKGRINRWDYVSIIIISYTFLYTLFFICFLYIIPTWSELHYRDYQHLDGPSKYVYIIALLASILIGLPMAVVVVWVTTCAEIKRLHDIGRSGKWIILYYTLGAAASKDPSTQLLLRLIWFLCLSLISGQTKDNKYGSPPKKEPPLFLKRFNSKEDYAQWKVRALSGSKEKSFDAESIARVNAYLGPGKDQRKKELLLDGIHIPTWSENMMFLVEKYGASNKHESTAYQNAMKLLMPSEKINYTKALDKICTLTLPSFLSDPIDTKWFLAGYPEIIWFYFSGKSPEGIEAWQSFKKSSQVNQQPSSNELLVQLKRHYCATTGKLFYLSKARYNSGRD